jgi:RNA polymerase sigma-70 factor, ECF subfamily
MASASEFESLVARFYEPLYQFAFSLTRSEADAADLTQQTFYVWATKGHQLRDMTKVKTWLFTTLHRLFLESQRRRVRFPHQEIESAETELPVVLPGGISRLDSAHVLASLACVDKHYQSAVTLFYLEDCSYQEIAEILELPLGTVKSRISRGIGQLQKIMAKEIAAMSPPKDRKQL